MVSGSWKQAVRSSQSAAAGVLACALFTTVSLAQAPVDGAKQSHDEYKTLYFKNLTNPADVKDVLTDMRNMLGAARVYYVSGRNAISISGPPDTIARAEVMMADLDKLPRQYRLTYTFFEGDGEGNRTSQKYSLVVVPGTTTTLKEGSRVPVVTGAAAGESAAKVSQVQYLDIGLNIKATLDEFAGGVRLQTGVEQSSLAEQKGATAVEDPVIRQTTLQGTMTLEQGKPVLLGSLDIPGSTRHIDVQVESEMVR